MSTGKFLNLLKKGISVDLGGSNIPVFFLDESYLLLTISPTTTAAAVCVAVRGNLGLKNDAYYALYEYQDDGEFQLIEDSLAISKIICKWPQDNAFGPRRLVYKRSVYLPKSPSENEEAAATTATGAHFLAFIDAEFNFLHGHYRLEPPAVAKAAACLLAGYRGSFDPIRDTLDSIRPVVADLVPLYALKGPGVPAREGHPRGHGIGQAATALTVDDMSARVFDAFRDMAGSGVSELLAQRMFIASCKASGSYGREVFAGKRTWKETVPAPASSGAGGAGGKGAAALRPSEIARTEDCFVAVGHAGIQLLGADDPLKSESFGYARIVKWVVSRDGKIFAFNLEDDRIIYVVTEAAGFIERCVERYVEEMVRYKGGKSEAERWAAPRESSGPGVTGMAAYLSAHARPSPAYAFVPTPAQQAAVATALAGAAASKPADAGAGAAGSGSTGGRAPAGPSAELPPHWRALKDAEGDTFYWNELTLETTWYRPKPVVLPPNWTSAKDAEGDVFYVNTQTGEASWFPPDPDAERRKLEEGLPPGWGVRLDSEGDPFYVHASSGKSSWYRPNPDGTFAT